MEKVQGSSLLPVNVERKITLVGRHLHLFQVGEECWLRVYLSSGAWWVKCGLYVIYWRVPVCDQDEGLDYECVLTIEGRSVVVDAYVEPDDTQPSLYFITCQLHQVSLHTTSAYVVLQQCC